MELRRNRFKTWRCNDIEAYERDLETIQIDELGSVQEIIDIVKVKMESHQSTETARDRKRNREPLQLKDMRRRSR
eukprot:6022457-Pyramimonas_sp.AAC.1